MKSSYLYAKILITGGIVLGLELVASRIMTPFFGVSLYVWSSILSVTLMALACGYKFGGMAAQRLSLKQTELIFVSSGALAALWMDFCLWTYPFIFLPLANFHLVFGSIIACFYLLFFPLIILSALNPLLVCLLAKEEKTGDRGAGSVFFISTVGSVLGVFIVTYGLLEHVTNYQAIVILAAASAGLSLVLLLMAAEFKSRAFRYSLILAVAGFLIAGGTLIGGGLERLPSRVAYNGKFWRVIHSAPSYFGYLQTVEISDSGNEGATTLVLLNDGMLQNWFYSPGVSLSPYTYALEKLAYAAAVPDPKNVLVLGIGGGVLPMSFERAGLDVHAIDINKKIVDMAQDHLGFEPGTMKIDIEDARITARSCQIQYDIIAVDLFRDDGIPEHLVTREFFSDIKNCLKNQGVMVMNSFMHESFPLSDRALLQTIASVFGSVYFLPGSNGYIVTRKGDPIRSLDLSFRDVPPQVSIELSDGIKKAQFLRFNDPALQNAPVLTDVSNQWKRIAHAAEVEYRKSAVKYIPWQILMN